MKKIVVTDLDGTLLAKDSYFRAIFKLGRRLKPIAHLPRLFYNFSLYAANLRTRSQMKALSFRIFFKGISSHKLDNHRDSFINSLKINYSVLAKVREYQQNDYEIYIVSASPDIYVKEITEKLGFSGYLCTGVCWKNNKLSGLLSSHNCINQEKVNRIQNDILHGEAAHIVSFGNSRGDYEMFKLSDEYYFVKKGELYHNYPLPL